MTPKEALVYIKSQVITLNNDLRKICWSVYGDKKFRFAPGSTKIHHAYPGGLLVHTAEVMEYALSAKGGNPKVLIPAALFHDYLKILERDYDGYGNIVELPFRKLVRHVAGSYAEFHRLAYDILEDQELYEAISHCLVSHHGRPEWGSAIVPQTPDATILHWADMMSWQFGEGR